MGPPLKLKIIVFTEKGEKELLFVNAEKAVHNTSLDLIELQNESDVPVAFIFRLLRFLHW